MKSGAVALLVCTFAMSGYGVSQSDSEFKQLFNGSLEGWSIQNTEFDNFRIVDDLLRVAAPQGWLRSDAEYGEFDNFRIVDGLLRVAASQRRRAGSDRTLNMAISTWQSSSDF